MKTIVLFSNTSWYLWNFRKGTIQALLAEDYKVICIAPLDEYSDKLRVLGVEFYAIPLEGGGTAIISELFSAFAIFNLVRKLKPDFVFNFTIKMNIYSGISCRLLKIPYANNVSGLGTAFLHEGLRFKLAQLFYGFSNKGAEKVFLQNDEDRQIFLDKNLADEKKTCLIPGSGVDLERFEFTPLPSSLDKVFLMIGRLIGDKGVREYLEAAALIKAQYPDTRFILIGQSGVSNKTAITDEEVNAIKQQGIVEFMGAQEDVLPWLKLSHVFVLPSYREGMPRTVLEAASVGRPAIVSDVPGCRQAIKADETGWLCQVKSASDLACVMETVINLDDETIGQFSRNARANAENHFSEQIVIGHYLDCLS